MHKITPVYWKTLVKVFEAHGWRCDRQKGDHRIYCKDGFFRPIVIPEYNPIGVDIILNNLRTAQISREEYLATLARVR